MQKHVLIASSSPGINKVGGDINVQGKYCSDAVSFIQYVLHFVYGYNAYKAP